MGNTASPEAIGHWAGISPGTVVNCTNCVMVALLSLHNKLVHLLTAEKKESTKAWVAGQMCPEWSNGHLMVNGTKFLLFQWPGLYGDAWFDKNQSYLLDCQVCTYFYQHCCNLTFYKLVTLPNSLVIIDYALGHTSSIHDSLAFQSTRIFKEHNQILTPSKWIWADSAYPAKMWCIAPFQKPVGSKLLLDQRTYNYHVLQVSPHAIFLFYLVVS